MAKSIGRAHQVDSVGIFTPKRVETDKLGAGEGLAGMLSQGRQQAEFRSRELNPFSAPLDAMSFQVDLLAFLERINRMFLLENLDFHSSFFRKRGDRVPPP